MKYLKIYNEELKSSTYKSAADKLKQMGHIKRPEEIMNWHEVTRKREDEVKKSIEDAIDSLWDVYQTLGGKIKNDGDAHNSNK